MTPRRPGSLLLAGLCSLGLALCLFFRADYFGGIALTFLRWPLVALLALLAWRLRHRALPFVLCLLFAVGGAAQWALVTSARAEPARRLDEPRTLRVVTHNVMFRGARLDDSLRMLAEQDADLVALQEVTPGWERALDRTLLAALPHKSARAHVGTHGFAVYARWPVHDVTWLDNAAGRPIAQCFTLDVPGSPLPVCNVHLASPAGALGKPGLSRLRALEANASERTQQWDQLDASFPEAPALLALGDFNTLEFEPLYGGIATRWVDAYRETNADAGATWPYRVHRLPPFARIDYVFTAGAVTPKSSAVLARSGSDHLAVRAELEIAAAR